MWHLDWEIEDWFNTVKRKRDAKYGNTSTEEVEPEWEENSLFDDWEKELRGGELSISVLGSKKGGEVNG